MRRVPMDDFAMCSHADMHALAPTGESFAQEGQHHVLSDTPQLKTECSESKEAGDPLMNYRALRAIMTTAPVSNSASAMYAPEEEGDEQFTCGQMAATEPVHTGGAIKKPVRRTYVDDGMVDLNVKCSVLVSRQHCALMQSTTATGEVVTENPAFSVRMFFSRHLQPQPQYQLVRVDGVAEVVDIQQWFTNTKGVRPNAAALSKDMENIQAALARASVDYENRKTVGDKLSIVLRDPPCMEAASNEKDANGEWIHPYHALHVHVYMNRYNEKGQLCQYCIGFGLVPLIQWHQLENASLLVPISDAGDATSIQALVHVVRSATNELPRWVAKLADKGGADAFAPSVEMLRVYDPFVNAEMKRRGGDVKGITMGAGFGAQVCYDAHWDYINTYAERGARLTLHPSEMRTPEEGASGIFQTFRRTMIKSRFQHHIPVYFPLYEGPGLEPSHPTYYIAVAVESCRWFGWSIMGFCAAVRKLLPDGKEEQHIRTRPHGLNTMYAIQLKNKTATTTPTGVKADDHKHDSEDGSHNEEEDDIGAYFAHQDGPALDRTANAVGDIYVSVLSWFPRACGYLTDTTCRQDKSAEVFDQWLMARTMPDRSKTGCDCEDTAIDMMATHAELRSDAFGAIKDDSGVCQALHQLAKHYCFMGADSSILSNSGQAGDTLMYTPTATSNPLADLYDPSNPSLALHMSGILAPWSSVVPFLHGAPAYVTERINQVIGHDVVRRSASLAPVYAEGTVRLLGSYTTAEDSDTMQWNKRSVRAFRRIQAHSPAAQGGLSVADWETYRPNCNRVAKELVLDCNTYRMLLAVYPIDLFTSASVAVLTPSTTYYTSTGTNRRQGITHQVWRQWSMASSIKAALLIDRHNIRRQAVKKEPVVDVAIDDTFHYSYATIGEKCGPARWDVTDVHPTPGHGHWLASSPDAEQDTRISALFAEFIDNRPALSPIHAGAVVSTTSAPVQTNFQQQQQQQQQAKEGGDVSSKAIGHVQSMDEIVTAEYVPSPLSWAVPLIFPRNCDLSTPVGRRVLQECDDIMYKIGLVRTEADRRVPTANKAFVTCVHYVANRTSAPPTTAPILFVPMTSGEFRVQTRANFDNIFGRDDNYEDDDDECKDDEVDYYGGSGSSPKRNHGTMGETI